MSPLFGEGGDGGVSPYFGKGRDGRVSHYFGKRRDDGVSTYSTMSRRDFPPTSTYQCIIHLTNSFLLSDFILTRECSTT